MEPLFFGDAARRLYGVHHPPLRKGRRGAVLLCYPSVQEYMGTHWAFRKLAGLLARDGFDVLRFDYYGTGNSAGESHEGDVEIWLQNIREAAAELKDIANVREISVVGMRLGAALAAMASANGLTMGNLVLWDPAVNGKMHVQELRRVEKNRNELLRQGPRVNPHELMGYPFPKERCADLARLDMLQLGELAAQRVHIVVSERRPDYTQLESRLWDRAGNPPTFQFVPDEANTGLEEVLLSTKILQTMAACLAEQAA